MNINSTRSCDKIRFEIDDVSTNWVNNDDSFINRIDEDNLNPDCPEKHLKKEIEIKNRLDEGIVFFNEEKYPKAIGCFDDVIYYDSNYAEALFFKSRCLQAQGHFVKALRYYRKAINADGSFEDIGYHKTLQRQANEERSNFPKIKLNIYNGDEYFARADYNNALESYDRALSNPSKFKEKILFKLLNKKATALFRLNRFDESLDCFFKSLNSKRNDYAIYGIGCCQYRMELELIDEFKRPLAITKEQSINQILILNDLGFFRQSLLISTGILENHFVLDELYFKLVECKIHALDAS